MTTTELKELNPRGTIRVSVLETEVVGVKAWHFMCQTCGEQSRRFSRPAFATQRASEHRCTRWGH
jgi:hypothetical protein